MKQWVLRGLIACLCLMGLVSGQEQRGQASLLLEVDTLVDERDGSCSDGDCSLRDAIDLVPSGATVSIPLHGTLQLSLGELVIDRNMNIRGPGYDNLVISAGGAARVVSIQNFESVTITDLSLANGIAEQGGGIYNAGFLDLARCTILNNTATQEGGGVYNEANSALDVKECSFIGNQAQYGGGVKNAGAQVSLWNSTFRDNVASARGGGVDNDQSEGYVVSTVEIKNSTFSGNTNGGVTNPASVTTATNTLIAGNLNYDCQGDFADKSAFNLSSDDICYPGFKSTTLLALRLDWSGWVFVLQAGSSAIEAGTNTGCLSTDQLDTPRPQDGDGDGAAVCDVGAYERPSPAPIEVRLFLPLGVKH